MRYRPPIVPSPQAPLQFLTGPLFSYRATSTIHLPFRVHPIITEHSRTRVSYEIAIKATFSPKLYATDVLVRVPTPLNTADGKFRCSNGKAKWERSENVVEWKYPPFPFPFPFPHFSFLWKLTGRIARFAGGAEYSFSGEATLSSDTHRKAWSRPPISMEFSIVMFTSSGLLVRYLKVIERGGYSSVKWVKYITRAAKGSYEIRF
jgi:AP-2 complex subunit mu-1